ncbi:hypothetical protein RYZ27_03200 [Hyphomonas sp. FCG-A18]|uniref:hypothetical protein n=1 Tax=Hyphomonas sp. FCG-A18 TaxID=3080019 RepID=UPI002B2A7EFA|nr:hypothetical protein RYZ27_03200 [Hyphomonas sp. FCG-A18]
MRNSVVTRLKTLLTAVRVTLYTKGKRVAKPKFNLEPAQMPIPDDGDAWLFDQADALQRETRALAADMGKLSGALGGLRETLDMITGVTPFPVAATTEMPCAITTHDSDLFDGEPEAPIAAQDTTIGGDAAFLFEEYSHQDAREQQAA